MSLRTRLAAAAHSLLDRLSPAPHDPTLLVIRVEDDGHGCRLITLVAGDLRQPAMRCYTLNPHGGVTWIAGEDTPLCVVNGVGLERIAFSGTHAAKTYRDQLRGVAWPPRRAGPS